MDIVANKEKLITALKIADKAVSKNITLPVLGTFLLKTDNGRLKVSATNLELGINCWLGAKINKTGEIAVPARLFLDFVGNVTDEKVELIAQKNILTVNSENYKTQIMCMEAKDFPIIPQIKKDVSFQISRRNLRTALLSVLDSTSLSETRPELNGIYVNISPDRAEFAATDSFRLSEKIINLEGKHQKTFILPRNAAIEIIRIAEDNDDNLFFAVSENQILIHGEDFEMISRLIDGHYPEYKRVIPEKFISLARINKTNFEKSIRMASVFSSSISDVKLKVTKDLMEISAQNSTKGEITANVVCAIKDRPFEISVNYQYLLDGLKTISSEDIILEFTGDGSPLVLKG